MKKILSILLVVGLIFVSADSFAQMNRFNVSQKLLTVSSVNNAGSHATTDITTASVLVAGSHRILGYSVTFAGTPAAGAAAVSTEIYASLYDSDATTDNLTTAKLISEAEARSAGDAQFVWFPYPKEIATGIIVQQGAYTCVTVYYEYYNGA